MFQSLARAGHPLKALRFNKRTSSRASKSAVVSGAVRFVVRRCLCFSVRLLSPLHYQPIGTFICNASGAACGELGQGPVVVTRGSAEHHYVVKERSCGNLPTGELHSQLSFRVELGLCSQRCRKTDESQIHALTSAGLFVSVWQRTQ